MSIQGGVANAFARGEAVGCACMQIFARNPRQWRAIPLAAGDVAAVREARRRTRIWPVVAHANYLVNLAARDRATYRRSLNALEADLVWCERLGLPGVVVHPGAHAGRGVEAGIARIADSINRLLDRPSSGKAKILLETTAGQGQGVGSRFEHLAEIIERVASHRRVGVCLDTCHVFAAGYDLRTEAAYERTWAEFDATVGRSRLEVIHLNDCKGALGSHLDRHEHIGQGHVGRGAFRLLMQDPRLDHVPKILETPKGQKDHGVLDRRNLSLLRRLARR